uniref:Integron gene cassette protein n=1 Tax=Macrostomum lignano TaxID=282301 RepID=A0A1I8JDU6_9PLAT
RALTQPVFQGSTTFACGTFASRRLPADVCQPTFASRRLPADVCLPKFSGLTKTVFTPTF